MDAETLIDLQKELSEKISNTFKNFCKESISNRTLTFLAKREQTITELWAKFEKRHEEIFALIPKASRPQNSYLSGDLYNKTDDIQAQMNDKIAEWRDKALANTNLQECTSNQSNQQNTLQPTIRDELRLQPISIDKFGGEYHNWISFRELFISLIHNNNRITKIEKLHYLKNNLIGEANRLINHLTLTNDNYDAAWNLLKDRYNNIRILINSELKRLITQTNIITESPQQLRKFLDHSKESINALKGLDIDITTWDPILIYLLVQKLDNETHKQWELSLANPTQTPTLEQFFEYIENRFHALESINWQQRSDINKSSKRETQFTPQNSRAFITTDNNLSCPICKNQHIFRMCPTLHNATTKDRFDIVQQYKRCLNCLGAHDSQNCNSKSKCFKCGEFHHTLLHDDENLQHLQTHQSPGSRNPFSPKWNQNNKQANSFSTHHIKDTNQQVLLSTALIHAHGHNGLIHTLRCLLDQGSQTSFITERAVQLLKLKKSAISATISALGAVKTETSKGKVELTIQSKQDPNCNIVMEALVLSKITNLLPSQLIKPNWSHISNISLADPHYYTPGPIDILLGADVGPQIMLEGLILGPAGTPMAQKTRLGWILSGKTADTIEIQSFHQRTEIEDNIKKFWEIEEAPNTRMLTAEDEECERLFVDTHYRNESGRFVVALPFKETTSKLGKSQYRATQRFLQLENRFLRNNKFARKYKDIINEYIQLGHMKPVPTPFSTIDSYFLPHHAVEKECSTTTKLRIVFDASAKTSSGHSLNDILHVGPVMQQNLSSILLRWRKHAVIISADIEKMYRQILVNPKDTQFQKILWRECPEAPLQSYEITTVTFGMASSAFLAIRSLIQLAKESTETFPHASQVALKDFYVDDLLTGAETASEAILLQKQLSNMLHTGGFELRKWFSNNYEVLRAIPENIRENNLPLRLEFEQTTKTLGIVYHPSSDHFQIKINLDEIQNSPTKRSTLSESSKLFDPLGWLAPVIIKIKILLQTIWKEGLEWDEQLSGQILTDWLLFRKELPLLSAITIPRWIGYTKSTEVQIHGFCDASESAYAAVLYTRVVKVDGTIQVTMLTSKTKVAPIQTLSMPRLELCAAQLLAKLIKHTNISLEIKSANIHAWTDSAIVIAWLRSTPSKWKSFVANRVSNIQQILNENQWRHVQSAENPADCASRGIFPAELEHHKQWWGGPFWLAKPESTWQPSRINIDTTNIDIKRSKETTVLHSQVNNIEDFLNDYSSLTKATRILAFCFRFIYNCKKGHIETARKRCNKKYTILSPLTNMEYRNALSWLIKSTQQQYFQKDILRLKAKRPLSNKSTLVAFNPFLDDDDLIRIGGRLEKADIPYQQKHPLILPKGTHIGKLIIEDAHVRTQHGATQATLNAVRHRYWIINGRNQIKHIIHQCVTCLRYRNHNHNQLMSSLPEFRLKVARAFTNVGVDYAGPLDLKASKLRTNRTYKAYIALFVCLSTKAIHIEVVAELTTIAFLAAFDRFSARRGLPSQIHSDNGTNFVGADKAIKRTLMEMLRNESFPDHFSKQGIEWHFIPPRSPHFGGMWEAGVKSFKAHFRRVVGSTLLTYEEIITVTTRIEACLNSRPLTPLTDDPSDLCALTPGHFLIGGEIIAPPAVNLSEVNIHRLTRWKLLQKMQQDFWIRWKKEYLHTLQQRQKWKIKKEELKIGDLVLLKEDDQPPLHWQLCRIEKLHEGGNNVTRVITLKTSKGSIKRPIVKIIPLPK